MPRRTKADLILDRLDDLEAKLDEALCEDPEDGDDNEDDGSEEED